MYLKKNKHTFLNVIEKKRTILITVRFGELWRYMTVTKQSGLFRNAYSFKTK